MAAPPDDSSRQASCWGTECNRRPSFRVSMVQRKRKRSAARCGASSCEKSLVDRHSRRCNSPRPFSAASSHAMPRVAVQDLSKTYRVAVRRRGLMGAARGLFSRTHRDIEALKRVSFSLEAGELVGMIGPNGAGKSTLIKILCGILEPSSGHCEVDGLVPWNERIRHVARIGVVFGQRTQLWWDLPVIDRFELLRNIYRVPEARFRATAAMLIALLRIEQLLHQPVRQLSLGQRMRCDIAAAMLHSPSILFLDEPTIGLDANSKLALREFVKTLNRDRGVTVILATHDMHDIEALAQRVLIT